MELAMLTPRSDSNGLTIVGGNSPTATITDTVTWASPTDSATPTSTPCATNIDSSTDSSLPTSAPCDTDTDTSVPTSAVDTSALDTSLPTTAPCGTDTDTGYPAAPTGSTLETSVAGQQTTGATLPPALQTNSNSAVRHGPTVAVLLGLAAAVAFL
jgi:hypothetical protein